MSQCKHQERDGLCPLAEANFGGRAFDLSRRNPAYNFPTCPVPMAAAKLKCPDYEEGCVGYSDGCQCAACLAQDVAQETVRP